MVGSEPGGQHGSTYGWHQFCLVWFCIVLQQWLGSWMTTWPVRCGYLVWNRILISQKDCFSQGLRGVYLVTHPLNLPQLPSGWAPSYLSLHYMLFETQYPECARQNMSQIMLLLHSKSSMGSLSYSDKTSKSWSWQCRPYLSDYHPFCVSLIHSTWATLASLLFL
jgi:hypothetical protein